MAFISVKEWGSSLSHIALDHNLCSEAEQLLSAKLPPGLILIVAIFSLVGEYLPFVIAFFAFIGVVNFIIISLAVKHIIKKVFTKEEDKRKIEDFKKADIILKIIISAGCYLLMFICILWQVNKYGMLNIIYLVSLLFISQFILVIVLKCIKRLNTLYLNIFLLIEPFVYIYWLLRSYYNVNYML